jgi:ribosomal protein S19E (S16A)
MKKPKRSYGRPLKDVRRWAANDLPRVAAVLLYVCEHAPVAIEEIERLFGEEGRRYARDMATDGDNRYLTTLRPQGLVALKIKKGDEIVLTREGRAVVATLSRLINIAEHDDDRTEDEKRARS